MPPEADIASNLNRVRDRIAEAAIRAGRDAASVTLLAVSKTFPAAAVREAAHAGQRHFAENRVQEGLDKTSTLADLNLDWHLIGHLQSNKARKAASAFAWIHAVDSVELVQKLDTAAQDAGTQPNILVQVDLAHEATKFGADAALAGDIARAVVSARSLRLRGLMIVPPIPEDPEASRTWFRRLRELRDDLVTSGIARDALAHLSMGMSQDFEVAIEEGATMVRVGTAIFGHR